MEGQARKKAEERERGSSNDHTFVERERKRKKCVTKKRKRMVLVQRGPQDTGKEYPRTVEDASLPSSSSS